MQILKKAKQAIATYIYNRRLIDRVKFHLKTDEIISSERSIRAGLVIVPCDPVTVIGSRGDEAMIMASVEQFRRQYPDETVTVISTKDGGADKIRKSGLISNLNVIESWITPFWAEKVVETIKSVNPRQVVILGADCMDGAWNVNLSIGLLGVYVMSTNLGFDTRLLGFSYNEHPKRLVNKAFRTFSGFAPFNLRDQNSLQRFEKFTKAKGRLVTDAAFMLSPDSDFSEYGTIKQWIEMQKGEGINRVIAFNFHPMLRQYTNDEEVKNDAISMAKNLHRILILNEDLSLLLLPHDDRIRISDNTMLKPIAQYLESVGLGSRFYYQEKVYRAAQIKAITGLVDGVVSSRMHLAIAALGMGKPVMAATYQGKFRGLFAHFMLSEQFLLEPMDFLDFAIFEERFNLFIGQLSASTKTADDNTPKVISLSKSNFK